MSRRTLFFHEFCPMCREKAVEGDLRKNLSLERIQDVIREIKKGSTDSSQTKPLTYRPFDFEDGHHEQPANRPHITGKLNYNLLADRDLRRMVRDLGLPERGDRRSLIYLHREFVLRFNAECDGGSGRAESDIRRKVVADLRREAVASGLGAAAGTPVATPVGSIFDRAAAAAAASASNSSAFAGGGPTAGDPFASLIADVMARRDRDKARTGGGSHAAESSPAAAAAAAMQAAACAPATAPCDSPRGRSGDVAWGVCEVGGGASAAAAVVAADGGGSGWIVPAPWVAVMSARCGRPFFYDPSRGVGSFVPPPGASPRPPTAATASRQAPAQRLESPPASSAATVGSSEASAREMATAESSFEVKDGDRRAEAGGKRQRCHNEDVWEWAGSPSEDAADSGRARALPHRRIRDDAPDTAAADDADDGGGGGGDDADDAAYGTTLPPNSHSSVTPEPTRRGMALDSGPAALDQGAWDADPSHEICGGCGVGGEAIGSVRRRADKPRGGVGVAEAGCDVEVVEVVEVVADSEEGE